eukprot:5864584-Prorocentrum_lima.AAC.1
MTSSLVGSEMCIRDRNLVMMIVEKICHLLHGLRTSLVPLTSAHQHCSVSYTHLTLPTICSV